MQVDVLPGCGRKKGKVDASQVLCLISLVAWHSLYRSINLWPNKTTLKLFRSYYSFEYRMCWYSVVCAKDFHLYFLFFPLFPQVHAESAKTYNCFSLTWFLRDENVDFVLRFYSRVCVFFFCVLCTIQTFNCCNLYWQMFKLITCPQDFLISLCICIISWCELLSSKFDVGIISSIFGHQISQHSPK